MLLSGKVQFAGDLYRGLDGRSDRTAILVHFDHTLYGLPILLLSGEMEGLLNPFEHKHLVLSLYLPDGIGVEAVLLKGNLTRCQRAFEGTQQSATCCCYQVIECGSVGLLLLG